MTWFAIPVLGIAIAAAIRGSRHCSRSFRSPGHERQSEWMIKGIRAWILAFSMISFAGWFYFGSLGWLIFGLVFLGEELVETGIMLLAVRRKKG